MGSWIGSRRRMGGGGTEVNRDESESCESATPAVYPRRFRPYPVRVHFCYGLCAASAKENAFASANGNRNRRGVRSRRDRDSRRRYNASRGTSPIRQF